MHRAVTKQAGSTGRPDRKQAQRHGSGNDARSVNVLCPASKKLLHREGVPLKGAVSAGTRTAPVKMPRQRLTQYKGEIVHKLILSIADLCQDWHFLPCAVSWAEDRQRPTTRQGHLRSNSSSASSEEPPRRLYKCYSKSRGRQICL
jgi:hypothetical protein